jgi:hypothetical protein
MLKEGVTPRWRYWLFWSYLLVLVFADATVTNPADPDLWHRLAVGEVICQTGHLPVGGTFSYLADFRNIADHEWGSGVIFYTLWHRFGPSAIVLVKLVTLGATLALLAGAGLMGRKPGMLVAAFYALVLLALLPSFQSTVRCMTFTHFFLALWLFWFQCERQGRPIPTWAYAATMIPWANLHGGFTAGLAWLAAVTVIELALRQGWKKWAIRFGLCLAATLVNPFGPQLWVSTLRALVTTRHGFAEWGPIPWWPDLLVYPGYKLLLLVVVASFVLLLRLRSWRKLDRSALFLIGGAMIMSLVSARHASLFAAVTGALLPGLLPEEPAARSVGDPILRMGYLALKFTAFLVPLYAAFSVLPGKGLAIEYPDNSCPVAAVDFLKHSRIHGRLLVPFNYGSYALWELRGQMRVSMDGRYDLVYLPETYQKVDDFFYARGDWHELLTTPKPDAILLPKADPIYTKLQTEPEWREANHDATNAVFLPK